MAIPDLTLFRCDKIFRGRDARDTYPPLISFMEIHEAAAVTQIPEHFIFKPQLKSIAQKCARKIISRILRVKWGSK